VNWRASTTLAYYYFIMQPYLGAALSSAPRRPSVRPYRASDFLEAGKP